MRTWADAVRRGTLGDLDLDGRTGHALGAGPGGGVHAGQADPATPTQIPGALSAQQAALDAHRTALERAVRASLDRAIRPLDLLARTPLAMTCWDADKAHDDARAEAEAPGSTPSLEGDLDREPDAAEHQPDAAEPQPDAAEHQPDAADREPDAHNREPALTPQPADPTRRPQPPTTGRSAGLSARSNQTTPTPGPTSRPDDSPDLPAADQPPGKLPAATELPSPQAAAPEPLPADTPSRSEADQAVDKALDSLGQDRQEPKAGDAAGKGGAAAPEARAADPAKADDAAMDKAAKEDEQALDEATPDALKEGGDGEAKAPTDPDATPSGLPDNEPLSGTAKDDAMGPPGGGGGAAASARAEVDKWETRVTAKIDAMPEPDLQPIEGRTGPVKKHGQGVKKQQKQKQKSNDDEARQLFKRSTQTLDDVKLPEDFFEGESELDAELKRVETAAKGQDKLPAQTLPDLQLTQDGTMPNLHGDPIPKETVDAMRELWLPPPEERGKDFDEMKALKDAMSKDPRFKGKVPIGGIEVSSSELQPRLEVKEEFKADITAVLAQVVATAPQWADKAMKEGRSRAYDGEAIEHEYGKNWPGGWRGEELRFVREEMDRAAERAGIKKEDLDAAVKVRQEKIKKQGTEQHDALKEEEKSTRDLMREAYDETESRLTGLRESWDEWVDEVCASFKGNVDAKAVRARQKRVQKKIRTRAADLIVAYDSMRKQRLKNLQTAMKEHTKAYNKAIAHDVQRDMADQTELKAGSQEYQTEFSKRFGEKVKQLYGEEGQITPKDERLPPIPEMTNAISAFDQANAKIVEEWQDNVKDARKLAVDNVRDWADNKIGRTRTWLDDILDWLFGWRDTQKEEADAFAKQRADEQLVDLETDSNALQGLVTQFGEAIDKDEQDKFDKLSDDQKELYNAYYKSGGDAITVLGTRMGQRMAKRRSAQIAQKIRKRLRSIHYLHADAFGLEEVSVAAGQTPNPSALALEVHSGVHYAYGTNEKQIFDAVGQISNKEGATAIRHEYFFNFNPHQDMDAAIKADMTGLFENDEDWDRVKAELTFDDKGKKDVVGSKAAQLRIAFQGWGGDHHKINDILRDLTDEERKKVLDRYEELYGEDLRKTIRSQIGYGYDGRSAVEMSKGNKDAAEAYELKDIQSSFYWTQSGRAEDFEKHAQSVSKSEKTLAIKEWRKEVAETPPGRPIPEVPKREDIEKRISKRFDTIHGTYKDKIGTDFATDVQKSFTGAFSESELDGLATSPLNLVTPIPAYLWLGGKVGVSGIASRPEYADMVLGLHRQKWDEVDAAKLEIERRDLVADDDIVNQKILGAEYTRALTWRREEAELILEREEQVWQRGHPGMIWDDTYRYKRKAELMAQAETAAASDATEHFKKFQKLYIDKYMPEKSTSDDFDRMVINMTTGVFGGETLASKETRERLHGGPDGKNKGFLPPHRELYYAAKDKDDKRIEFVLKGKTQDQIAKIRADWAANADSRELGAMNVVLENAADGRTANDIKIMLKYGEPTDPDTAYLIAQEKIAYENKTGGMGYGPNAWATAGSMDRQLERLKEARDRYKQGQERFPVQYDENGIPYRDSRFAGYSRAWEAQYAGVNRIVQTVRANKDIEADLISGLVALVVAVVLGAILAPFTAGASLLLIAAVAAAVAVASGLAAMAVKYAMKGDAYHRDEMKMDLLMIGVDVVFTVATLGAGKVLGPLFKGASKAGGAAGKAAGAAASKVAGAATVDAAEKGFMKKLASKFAMGARTTESIAARGGGLKGAWGHLTHKGSRDLMRKQATQELVSGLVTSYAVPAFTDEYAQDMNPIAQMMLGIGMGLGIGMASGAMVGKLQSRGPRSKGDFDFHGDVNKRVGDTSAILELAADPAAMAAMRKQYMDLNPFKTAKDFQIDFDEFILAQAKKNPELKRKFHDGLRTAMLADLPTAQRNSLSGTDVEMLSDAAFTRLTGSKSGNAVVIIQDGKAVVKMRAGASRAALAEEAIHLTQVMDKKWADHIKLVDESNLRRWPRMDVRERMRVYEAKLDLEIDANEQLLAQMKNKAKGQDLAPEAMARIKAVEKTLDNLYARQIDLMNISPLRRTLMAWGEVFKPGWLKQKPRLFNKTRLPLDTFGTKQKKVDIDKDDVPVDAEIDGSYYRLGELQDGLGSLPEGSRYQAHIGEDGTAHLRLVGPDGEAITTHVLVKRGKKFSVEPVPTGTISTGDLDLPIPPDGHYFIHDGTGLKLQGGEFELGANNVIKKKVKTDYEWDVAGLAEIDNGRVKLKDKPETYTPETPNWSKKAEWAQGQMEPGKVPGFEKLLDDLDLPGKGTATYDGKTSAVRTLDDSMIGGMVDRGVLRRMEEPYAILRGLDDALENVELNGTKLKDLVGDLDAMATVDARLKQTITDLNGAPLSEAAYNQFRKEIRDAVAQRLAVIQQLDLTPDARKAIVARLADALDDTLVMRGGSKINRDNLSFLDVALSHSTNKQGGKGNLFTKFREEFTQTWSVPELGATPAFGKGPKDQGQKLVVRKGPPATHRISDGIVTIEHRPTRKKLDNPPEGATGEALFDLHDGVPNKTSEGGFMAVDDKAGTGAFKIDQAVHYVQAQQLNRNPGLEGVCYFFDSPEAAFGALAKLKELATTRNALGKGGPGTSPPRIFLGYFDGNDIVWVNPHKPPPTLTPTGAAPAPKAPVSTKTKKTGRQSINTLVDEPGLPPTDLHHGTSEGVGQSIREGIRTDVNSDHPGRRQFGRGFYLGEDLPTALKYAHEHTDPHVVTYRGVKMEELGDLLDLTRGPGKRQWEDFLDSDMMPGFSRRDAWRNQEARESLFEEFLRQHKYAPDVVIAPHLDARQIVIRTPAAAARLQVHLAPRSHGGPPRIASIVDEQLLQLAMHAGLDERQAKLLARINADDTHGVGITHVDPGEVNALDLAALTRFHPQFNEYALVRLKNGKTALVDAGSYKGGQLPPDIDALIIHSHPPDGGSGMAKFISEADVDAVVQLKQTHSYMVLTDGTVYRFGPNTPPNSIGELVRKPHPVHGWVDAQGRPAGPLPEVGGGGSMTVLAKGTDPPDVSIASTVDLTQREFNNIKALQAGYPPLDVGFEYVPHGGGFYRRRIPNEGIPAAQRQMVQPKTSPNQAKKTQPHPARGDDLETRLYETGAPYNHLDDLAPDVKAEIERLGATIDGDQVTFSGQITLPADRVVALSRSTQPGATDTDLMWVAKTAHALSNQDAAALTDLARHLFTGRTQSKPYTPATGVANPAPAALLDAVREMQKSGVLRLRFDTITDNVIAHWNVRVPGSQSMAHITTTTRAQSNRLFDLARTLEWSKAPTDAQANLQRRALEFARQPGHAPDADVFQMVERMEYFIAWVELRGTMESLELDLAVKRGVLDEASLKAEIKARLLAQGVPEKQAKQLTTSKALKNWFGRERKGSKLPTQQLMDDAMAEFRAHTNQASALQPTDPPRLDPSVTPALIQKRVLAVADDIGFRSLESTAYHAIKHIKEMPESAFPDPWPTGGLDVVSAYVNAARELVRNPGVIEVRRSNNGYDLTIFQPPGPDKTRPRAIVRVDSTGDVYIKTYGD